MKILLMSKTNKTKRIQEGVSKAGYKSEVVKDVSTSLGKNSGVVVEISDTSEILILCKEFTETEKVYDIGVALVSE